MKKLISIIILTYITLLSFGQSKKPSETGNSKPFVLGSIEEIYSNRLSQKRILNIYLPEGYNSSDTIHYPVIYLLDGSADEDFIHIVGLVQYNSFEWINRVPKSIVVGIATVDRRRDYTFPSNIADDKKKNPTSGHSESFIDFIETELQPFIEKKYKTNSSRTIIGQSLGGLLATEILFKKPTLFNKYIIISPSLWWDNGSLLSNDLEKLKESSNKVSAVYIGVGKEGLTPTVIPRVMEVDANLLAEKIQSIKVKNIKLAFDYLPEENHATIMHQAVLNAFRVMFAE
ncbi:alpha/beta hydrolase [Flavihumibacter sp. ZG627]|uniref:alpha/beta hydrolase n=1 Tax=Flavihumibacter sp. ZG627 TaxID=1463156 RepID=UPI00057E1E8A|nr:alpha/beta hydrolase-fold protein [Flavihumibacter sp. ZG627]KIC91653.1 esterase [Flavihumibacter sp. ZG627]